jgi:hypothetical protein
MTGIKITADKTLRGRGQVCDIVNDFKCEWLPVDIEDGIPVNVEPEHVSAVHWATLLS